MTVTANVHYNISPWTSGTYAVGNRRSNAGNAYECTTAGNSTAAPTGTGSSINNGGTAVFKWLSAVDYTNLQAWANALPATLDQQYQALVWTNGSPATTTLGVPFVSINGKTTTAGNNIRIQAAAGKSFRDKVHAGAPLYWNGTTPEGAFQLPASGTGGINYFDLNCNNVVIDGLQFRDPNSTSGSTIFGFSGNGGLTISGCLFDGYGQSAGASIISYYGSGGTNKVFNSIIIDRSATGANGYSLDTTATSIVFLSNTIYAPANPTTQGGIYCRAASGSATIHDNIVIGYSAANVITSGGIALTPDHNLFSAASLSATNVTTGTGNLFSRSAYNQFVDSASDLRLAKGADAIDSGVADTTNNVGSGDIKNDSFGSVWDIGAASYVAFDTIAPSSPLRTQATVRKCVISSGSCLGYLPTGTVTSGATYTATIWVYIPSGQSQITTIVWKAEGNVSSYTTGSAALTKTNTWQRLSCTFTMSAASTNVVLRATASSSGSICYVTCPQIEAGSNETSYIPTAGSTVTRAADRLYQARGIFTDPSYSTLLPVFRGVQAPWVMSETTLDIGLRDASYWLDRPIQSSQYLGTGSYEGTADLAGQTRPITRGGTAFNPIQNVTAVCIDPTNLIYQYNDAAGTVVNLYEGGATTITRQGDTTNLYSGTTTAGQFRTDNSRGLFQLGSNPQAAITIDCTGQFPTAGAQSTALQIARYLMTETLSLPAAYIDTTNFTNLGPTYGFTSGIYIASGQTMTGIEALDWLLGSWGAKLYSGRDGKLRVLPLRAPASTNAVATFDSRNTISIVPQELPTSVYPPPYRMRVGYNHNYTVQSSGYLASTSATRKQFIANADRFAISTSATVQTAYTRPNDPDPLIGGLLAQSSAASIASDLMKLWGVRRRLYAVTVPLSVGIIREIGDTVSLNFPVDNLIGTPGVIVGESFRSADPFLTFQVLV